jgi:putative ABC transport system permease protein
MLKDYMVYILRNFSHRKMRGWLTVIGILIGVAAVVALVSVSQGMQEAIKGQFEKLGTNKLIIMPGGGEFFGAFASAKLTNKDLEIVRKVAGVDMAAELFFKMGKIKFNDQTKTTYIIGIPTDSAGSKLVTEMASLEAQQGRIIREGDQGKVAIGWFLWDGDFFTKKVALGNKVEIEGQEFKVIGLIKKIGNRQDDSQVYLPIEAARELFNEPDEISYIYIQTKDGYNVSKVAEDVKKDLRDYRDEKKGEETFQVQTFEQILSQVNVILNIVGLVLVTISAISLVVGGVGIMNSMYTSVLERTHEIGVMKAIGARNSHIMLIFLIESGLYGLVGGALGCSLGLGMAKLAEFAASQLGAEIFKASISATLILGSLGFSFLIGGISGLAPARHAAKMKPVEALRYE